MDNEQLHDGIATVVMDSRAIADVLERIAREIAAANPDVGAVALLGILRRGRPMADRLARLIGETTGVTPKVGSLATTLYRDDLRANVGQLKAPSGETYFDFNLDGLTVVLVDDVLAAGRTIRAAMDELMDYGRPARIQLACLVDRGGRELPIQPDYLGKTVNAGPGEHVAVRFEETDGLDVVRLERKAQEPDEGGSQGV